MERDPRLFSYNELLTKIAEMLNDGTLFPEIKLAKLDTTLNEPDDDNILNGKISLAHFDESVLFA